MCVYSKHSNVTDSEEVETETIGKCSSFIDFNLKVIIHYKLEYNKRIHNKKDLT